MRDLAQGLLRKGIKVTVVTGCPSSALKPRGHFVSENDENGITVFRFSYPNLPPRHTVFQLANLKNLRDTIKRLNPDLVHGQSGSTYPVSDWLKEVAPIVVTFHTCPNVQKDLSVHSLIRGGTFSDFQTYVLGYPAWSYTSKKELQASKASVTVSKTLRLDLLKEMGERYQSKITEIHNGVDTESLSRDYNSVKDSDETSTKTIIFAGRFFWGKGVLELIRIASLLKKEAPDFRIIIHGKGPLFGKVSSKIKELELNNIELCGFADRLQMMKSMRRSTFVVIPSFYEACPMTLLEGMCLGKIPLMFRYKYALEFTKNGTYGVIAKDPKDMVEKLLELCKTQNLSSLSNEIQVFARKNYDIARTAESYLQVYRNVQDL